MNQGEITRLADMRMRIRIAGRTVRGPARVADANRARRLALCDELVESVHLALLLQDLELTIDKRYAGRIITAVLESLEPVNEYPGCVLFTDVSDNTTHRVSQ